MSIEKKDEIDIVVAEMDYLRDQITHYSESQRALGKLAILGIAAVVAVRKDLTINDYVTFIPFVPIVALGLIAFMVAENAFIFRCGAYLARDEGLVNRLAGSVLLTHEQEVWKWRLPRLGWKGIKMTAAWIAVTGLYWGSIPYSLAYSEFNDRPAIRATIWTLAAGAYAVWAIFTSRMVREMRNYERNILPELQGSDNLGMLQASTKSSIKAPAS